MNIVYSSINKDSESEKLLGLQSNKLVQEQMIWQNLTLQKLNEMNHIPDKDITYSSND